MLAIKREPLGQALILINALSDKQLSEALDIQRKLRAGEEAPSAQPNAARTGHLQVAEEKYERLSQQMARLRICCRTRRPRSERPRALWSAACIRSNHATLRGAFRRTAAMIRELADKQHKRIEVSLHGEDIELERTLLSAVSDALVHLGRNAVDHGIEYEIERVASQKNEVARISLVARTEAHEVVIDVVDDGHGLRRERILQKAIALNLVAAAAAPALRDEEVFALIFSPGFSTAEAVTDVSGRGVGMDAVKHAVESFGGSVEVTSTRGQGTCFRLRLRAQTRCTELRTSERAR